MTARAISEVFALAVVALLALPTTAHASFAGANGRIAFSRNGNIFTVAADGTDRFRLTEGPAGDHWPTYSPDGRYVAFLRSGPNGANVFIARADGSSIRRVTHDLRGYAQPPVWSPDGSRLAFEDLVERGDEMGGAICVVRPSGGPVTRLTGYWPRAFHPSWSPDSTRLAFARHGIVVIDADGTNKVRLSVAETIEQTPQWSPSGDRIVFARSVPGPPQEGDLGAALVSIAPDGTGERTLTDGVGFDHHPRWSPDGTRIAFLDFDPSAGTDVWVMNADGSGLRPLTTGRIAGQSLVWSPDGSKIAFDDWNDVLIVGVTTGELHEVTSSPLRMELLGDWQAIAS